MGYTTEFEGTISIEPPLSPKEVEYINKFADTRRMNRKNGAYFVGGSGYKGQDNEEDVIDHNQPPEGQPSLWCQWVASEDGETLGWDYGEKFYDATAWMDYLIVHFLGTNPVAKENNKHFGFLQGHTLNGEIFAQGEDPNDVWKIVVTNNKVEEKQGTVIYEE